MAAQISGASASSVGDVKQRDCGEASADVRWPAQIAEAQRLASAWRKK